MTDPGGTRNEVGGPAVTGSVVQTGEVRGGVHIHGGGTDRARPVPRQLPTDAGIFVNRQPELRTLTRMSKARTGTGEHAVVVTGSAGVGKTALVLHWAHRTRSQYPDGELYADLRGFDADPAVPADVVLDRFLRALGVAPDEIPGDLDGRAALFRSLVADRQILVILDNAADIGQVRPLLPAGAGAFALVTSRSQLPGLAIRDGARRIRLDILQEAEAVSLLRRVTRGGGRRDEPADLAELARLCARLPLALRVAAEHAVSRPALRLSDLITDLRDHVTLWEALSVGEGPHGEAVRTVFAWSYRDLSPKTARMFRVLGVHAGPAISLTAAAAAAGLPVRATRRELDLLVGAFLVEEPRPGRYQLHSLLHAYARDQAQAVDSAEDRGAVTSRLARWYAATACSASAVLAPGRPPEVEPQPPQDADPLPFETADAALEWFDAERASMGATIQAALEAGLPDHAWELAISLSQIHATQFTFDDWSAVSDAGITAATAAGDERMLAVALDNRAGYLSRRGLLADAKTAYEQALSLHRATGSQPGAIAVLSALGRIAIAERDFPAAIASLTSAAEAARAIADTRWEAVATSNLAGTYLDLGQVREAWQLLDPLPDLLEGLGDRMGHGNALWLQSRARRQLGDPAGALAAITAALRTAEDSANRMAEGLWLIEAARVRLTLGDAAEAMRCCRQAAALQRQIGDHAREALALDCAGEVYQAMGSMEDAAAFHGQAARMHRQLGDRWQEALATIRLADCEAALGRDDLTRESLTRALALLDGFTDEPAAAIQSGIRARLAES